MIRLILPPPTNPSPARISFIMSLASSSVTLPTMIPALKVSKSSLTAARRIFVPDIGFAVRSPADITSIPILEKASTRSPPTTMCMFPFAYPAAESAATAL